jgi:cytosine/adenosine deaminase-related metal-dependent hydrolase
VLYLADMILPMADEPIPHGAVRVEANRVIAVGPAADLQPKAGEEVCDFGAATLLPGLINAHCHLDYTGFHGALEARRGFTEWIKKINALRRTFTPADYLDSIAEGFGLLAAGGVTTVLNVESFPELLPLLAPPPLRTWWFLELIDVRSRLDEETIFGALSFFEEHPDWLGGFGISPHAPYTASVDLYRLARTCGEQFGMLSTTHIGESVEEHEMFSHARGPLYEFLAELGRDNSDCGQGSPLSHLIEHGVIANDCLIVHLNYLQDYDYELLQHSGVSVVHCPRCHTYFSHAPFPLKALRDRGINICLGTDSLASNHGLDMRAEMREAMNLHGVSAREALQMSTLNGAKALHRAGELGQISPGSVADLAVFAHEDDEDEINPYQRVVNATGKPLLLLVEGRPVAL